MKAPAAELCPQCLAANRIAPKGGPTCTHQPESGVKWWPRDWDFMSEHERLAWLRTKQSNGMA